MPPLLAGALTALGALGFAAIQLMLGVETAGQPAGRARDPGQGPARLPARAPALPAAPPGAAARRWSTRARPAHGAARSRGARLRRRRGRRSGPARLSGGVSRPGESAEASHDVRTQRLARRAAARPSSRSGWRSWAAFALVIFSAIFFRLWYLEVLSGDRYLAEANNNQVREITVQAPRGRDRRPRRQDAGRQPHGARASGAHHRAARAQARRGREVIRAPGRGVRDERRAGSRSRSASRPRSRRRAR